MFRSQNQTWYRQDYPQYISARYYFKISELFNNGMESIMNFITPDTTHKGITQSQDTRNKLPKYIQKRYQSGIVLVLYILNHSRLGIANTINELSKYMVKSKHYALQGTLTHDQIFNWEERLLLPDETRQKLQFIIRTECI